MWARKPNDIYRMRKSRKTVRFLLFYGDSRAAVRFGPHDLLLAPRQYSMRLPGDFRVFTRTYGNRLGRNRAGLARTHVFSSVPRDASVSINSEDIFHSSAGYYTEFRKPYPQRIFDLARDKFQPDGQVDLLDVGCGTGQIALPLSKWFRRVVGVDLSAEMVGYARQNAIDQKIKNVDFHVLSGDDISSVAGEFRLVSYGSALHWMDIPKRLPPAIRCSHRAVASPSWACAVSGAESRTGNRPWSRSFGVGWGRTGGPARARSTRQFKKIFDLRMH